MKAYTLIMVVLSTINSLCDQNSGMLQVQAVTKIITPDHEDPDYVDICYAVTREMCDFCCLIDFEFCSRDICICEPVTDRHIDIIAHCGYVFVGVLMGFPIVVALL